MSYPSNRQPADPSEQSPEQISNPLSGQSAQEAKNGSQTAGTEKAKPFAGRKASVFRRPPLTLVRYYLPPRVHRPVIGVFRQLVRTFDTNSGDWAWLEQKPIPLKLLNRNLWRIAEPSSSYYIMLFISGVIAALGLLAGSAAAIIGAMIVAPLMGPIVGMAFAITVGNRRLLKRSGTAVITGSLLTIATAYFICSVVGISSMNPEILQRTQPTLIDLVIGLAAGAAGSFAQTRRDIAAALPGVAIAVALVPPLSVIGIGLALNSGTVATGATLLFLTNLAGIILSGGIIFIWQEYGSLKRAKKGLSASIAMVALLGIPLGLSMHDLIAEERGRSAVNKLVREETETFKDVDIRRVGIDSNSDRLLVKIEVAAPPGSITTADVDDVRQSLEQRLEEAVELEVNVFPMEGFYSKQTMPKKLSFRQRVIRKLGG